MPDPIQAKLLEESAEELYEHAPVGYLSTLPGGEIVRVNATLLEWTGHAREDLVGRKRLQDLLAPGARIYYETHYAPLLQMQGAVREIAVELVGADGRRLPALLNSTLVRDEDGNASVVRTTVFDATERRRYERELLRARIDAEARARAVLALEHVNDGVLLVGQNDTVDVVNPAAERILGLAADEAVGRPLSEVLPEWPALAEHIPVRAAGAEASFATVPLVRGDREAWLEAAGEDTGDGVVYTLRDVTGEHRLEEVRNNLVAVVSHELRTPLAGVYGAAQTLLSRYEGLEDVTRRQLLELVVGQSERLTEILDRVLLTSRLATGDVDVATEDFDAAAAAHAVIDRLPAATRSRLSVALDAPAGAGRPLHARADPQATRQVLAILVDNALKYSQGGVRVAVTAAGDTVRLTVADEGPGVPAAERDRVFERFYRLDPGQHGGVGGIGLGLYIARELVARMDGRIGLLPRDAGTTVFVDLPGAPEPG